MDSSTLSTFRTELYACFLKRSDTLMNATDALLTDCTAKSFVELSLFPEEVAQPLQSHEERRSRPHRSPETVRKVCA